MILAVFGPWEIGGLLVLALLLFGSKKLPELARGLGTGLKEFKKATSDVSDELHRAMEDDPRPQSRTTPPSPPTPRSSADSGDTEKSPKPESGDEAGRNI